MQSLLFVTMAVTIPSLKPPTCTPPMELRLCPRASRFQVGFFYFALYLMALGAGGIKACVSTFAGDQFDEGDEKESMKKKSFPNWWFVSISFGTMLSVSILVYVQVGTLGEPFGFKYAFLPCLELSLAQENWGRH